MHSRKSKQLDELFKSDWERRLDESPLLASYVGDYRANDKWDDISLKAIEQRHGATTKALAKAKKIDRSNLTKEQKINLDIFIRDVEETIEKHKYQEYLLPIDQFRGIQADHGFARFLKFEKVKHYNDWLVRMNAFPKRVNQTLRLMREGVKQKVMRPQTVLDRVIPQIYKQLVEDPKKSPWYAAFKIFPESFSNTDRTRIEKKAERIILGKIIPAFEKFIEYFVNDYLPEGYEEPGIWQHPNGIEYYKFLARSYTTTKLTPKQIHEKGKLEVRRIRTEMLKTLAKIDDFHGSLKQFFEHLRTDPKHFYQKDEGEELLEAYRAISKQIDPLVPGVVKTSPSAPYGVVPIPDEIAPDYPSAFYLPPATDGTRAGFLNVNLFRPETRPKWEMRVLLIHEGVPGHHTQVALHQELELPDFRKYQIHSAFTEGWALYTESLGKEMGLYENLYDKFGWLTFEMWRATRLVVDTGIHYYQWDRDRAIKYSSDNAPRVPQDIENEIDRYMSLPGQALAYKIGERKINELRQRASAVLGKDLDLREFHDVVLKSGSIPLAVLEKNVDEWLSKRPKR